MKIILMKIKKNYECKNLIESTSKEKCRKAMRQSSKENLANIQIA